jgi:integrase/recombinase XerC
LTHLGRSPGANLLLLLMAKSRHRKADSLRVYFHPSGEDIAAVTASLAPGDSRR